MTKFWKMAAVAALATGAFLAGCHHARADNPYKGSRIAADGTQLNWTGLYFGGSVGGAFADIDTSLNDGAKNLAYVDGFSGTGLIGDVRLTALWQPNGTPFTLGVFGGHRFGEVESQIGVGSTPATLTFTGTLDQKWYVGPEVGLALSGRSRIYVGYAWTQAEVTGSIFCPAGPCGPGVDVSASKTIDGKMLTAGLEHALTPNWFLGVEYNYTDWDQVTVGDPTKHHVNFDTNVHAGLVTLKFRPTLGWFGN